MLTLHLAKSQAKQRHICRGGGCWDDGWGRLRRPLPVISHQFPTQNCNCLSSQKHTITSVANFYYSTTCRSLITNQFVLTKSFTPERAQAAMSRTGHRILIYTYIWSKEARHEIILIRIGKTGHNNAPRSH